MGGRMPASRRGIRNFKQSPYRQMIRVLGSHRSPRAENALQPDEYIPPHPCYSTAPRGSPHTIELPSPPNGSLLPTSQQPCLVGLVEPTRVLRPRTLPLPTARCPPRVAHRA